MRKINIAATADKTYDLDKISEQSRDNAALPLMLQNWYWHPDASEDYENHKLPDPTDLTIGQIWVSIKCNSVTDMEAAIFAQATGGVND